MTKETQPTMNKGQMINYVHAQCYQSRRLLGAWIPVLLEVGLKNGHTEGDVLQYMAALGKDCANGPFAFQCLQQYLSTPTAEHSIADPRLRIVILALARFGAYHV